MTLAKRIIPCLDVTAGRVVKGVNFLELRDAGDPVEVARRYDEQGADEITFLDITATSDERDLILPIIEAVASTVFIPLTVGGGVRSVADVRRLLTASLVVGNTRRQSFLFRTQLFRRPFRCCAYGRTDAVWCVILQCGGTRQYFCNPVSS